MADISFSKALQESLKQVRSTTQTEYVSLENALSKVLAEDIKVIKDLPSFDNSAMDGFAYRYEERTKKLKIAKTIFAGDVIEPLLEANECYKIMTGAKIPNDVDTIAPFEKCVVEEGFVRVPQNLPQGANFRKKGEEVCVGEILLKKGTTLTSSEIALLAAQGITKIKVFKKLSIAVLSSGNELKEPWEEANEDEIYNANGFGIVALLAEAGFDPKYVGKLPDDLQATTSFIKELLTYDVIISTGGISAGEADFLYQAYKENGLSTIFKGVRLKPGHPVMIGNINNTTVIALPGNPLTTLVVAHALAIPLLGVKQGKKEVFYNFFYAPLIQELSFRGKRTTLVLGKMKNGAFYPTRGGKVGSGMLSPLCESDVIAYFDEETSSVSKDTLIKVVPLRGYSYIKEFALIN